MGGTLPRSIGNPETLQLGPSLRYRRAMTIQRLEHVGIVVDDLEAATVVELAERIG